MDPEDFQRFALTTLQGGRPVDCRVAISRAYYAIFNVAADLLRNAGCTISFGTDAHGKVPQHLLSVAANPAVAKAGSWIGEMKGVRNKADYRMADATIEYRPTAELWVREASNHIAAMKAAFAGTNRAGILADLRSYEAKMQPGYRPPQ
jgi:hypothetical protein